MLNLSDGFDYANLPNLEELEAQGGLIFGPDSNIFTPESWESIYQLCESMRLGSLTHDGRVVPDSSESFVEFYIIDSQIERRIDKREDYFLLGSNLLNEINDGDIHTIVRNIIPSAVLTEMNVNFFTKGTKLDWHEHPQVLTVVIVPSMEESDDTHVLFEMGENNTIEVPLFNHCVYIALGKWKHGTNEAFKGNRISIGLFYEVSAKS